MDIRVSDVKKWAGREEITQIDGLWPEVCAERVEFPLDGPSQLIVRVRNVGSGLLVDVHGDAQCQATCARCLEPFSLTVPFAIMEEFREEPGPVDSELEYSRFTGDRIILDELVADAISVSLPMVPTCREDCEGLCPQCGVNWNVASCECAPPADERFAVLRTLLHPEEDEDEDED